MPPLLLVVSLPLMSLTNARCLIFLYVCCMHVCMYVCMFVCIIHMYKIFTSPNSSIRTYVYMYMCVCVCVCVFVCVCVCVCCMHV
jgi:hypothetical protein